MRLKTAIITLITSSILLANTLSLGNNEDGTWNVNYSSDGEIGGFQFNVDGATINSASGGAAGDAGFMLTNSADLVLGFSLSGATIPSGEGILVVLDLDGTPTELINIIVSDPAGVAMDFTYDSGGDGEGDITDGCDLPDLNLYLSEDGEVFYNSSEAIGGFQFNVDGAIVNSATGGDAGAAGFMITSSSTTVLGFSLSGATFGPGCGTMVNLDINGDATGLK